MTSQIQDQIRTYVEYVDERVEPIDIEAVLDLSSRTPSVQMIPEPGGSAPRRIAVAFVAAAVITIAVLVPLIFLRGDAAPDVATTLPNTTIGAPSTTAGPQPTTTDSAVVRVAAVPPHTSAGWSWVVSGIDTRVNGRFADGTWYAFDSGWSCIKGDQYFNESDGGCDDGNAIADPAESLLISPDGTTWESEDVAVFAGLAVNQDIHGIGPLFATAWQTGVEPSQSPQTDWVTTNGRDWHEIVVDAPDELVNDPSFDFGALSIIHSSVRIGRTIVSLTSCRESGLVAVSSDSGLTWAIVDGLPDAVNGSCEDVRTHYHELFTIGGVFHALSYPTTVDARVLWRSADGMEWELVGETAGLAPWATRRDGGTPPPVDLGSAAFGVRHNDGFGAQPSATYVVSKDGLLWTEVDVPQCGAREPEAALGPNLAHRSADGSGWIIITPCGGGEEGYLLGHYSGDAFTWYRVDPPSDLENGTLYTTGNVLMAERAGSIWLAIPPE